jgi:hypothetical protein
MILEIVDPFEKPQEELDYRSLIDTEESQGFSLAQVFMIPNTLFPDVFDHDNIFAIGIRHERNHLHFYTS